MIRYSFFFIKVTFLGQSKLYYILVKDKRGKNMEGKLEEILEKIDWDTPIEEISKYCDSLEDIQILLSALRNKRELPELGEPSEKLKALAVENLDKIGELRPANVQKTLKCSYPNACRVIKWLKNTK